MALTMDKLVALCKGRGFVFAGSEIYGGLANTWDYGPLGVELKNNIKKAWWQKFVTEAPTNVGVDCSILMNTSVWEASGHVGGFSDPLMDCKSCKTRHRADNLVEEREDRRLEQRTTVRVYCGKSNRLPRLRQMRFHSHQTVQFNVQNVPGRYRGHRLYRISSPRNGARHFRQL